jgi:DNA (cytosine-5)-methyltransferase 1
MKILKAADLFCGAGGSSTGLRRVADALGVGLDLTALNHWDAAIETHAANHPEARHICEPIDKVVPRDAVGGRLDLLWASPACTDHSYAKGDKELSADDQSRSTAWSVLRWIDDTRPAWVFIENVPAFAKWGPAGRNGRPLASRRGETYRVYLDAIRSRGYTVEVRQLNSVDYGAATARPRLYIFGRFDGGRSRGPLPWPVPTHAEPGSLPLFASSAQPWRGAEQVIDWSLKGRSIFDRKKPIAATTKDRIEEGIRRFSGRPFVLGQQSGAVARATTEPLPTIATKGAISLIQPFLVTYYGSGTNVDSVQAPLRTITTRDRFGLVRPEGDDITLRMLSLRELARGMGFSDDYRFVGTQTDAKKMVGNAVEVNQAAALWRHPVEQLLGIRRAA